mgnify:CR=1 FL=1
MRVIVIGCGLAGVTTAYYLRSLGAQVTVLDRAAAPARETSYANGSMLTPSLTDPWNAPGVLGVLLRSVGREGASLLLRPSALPSLLGWGLRFLGSSNRSAFESAYLNNVQLALYSQATMRELLQTHSLQFEYAPDGTVKVFSDQEAFEQGRRVAHWLKQAQVGHREMDRDALLELEPALAPVRERLVGGIHYPGDEVGNARLFCEALKTVAEEAGVVFRFSEQILDVNRRGRRVESLVTPRETLTADAYVLAAGAYSYPLGKLFGLRVPVRPVKGYSLTVPVGDDAVGDDVLVPRYAVVDETLHAAVVPLGSSKLRVAGTAEFAGFDLTLTPKRLANLKGLLGQLYPQIPAEETTVEGWCGLRPVTPDGVPLLGPTNRDNLYLNTGHGALGWTQACGSGRAVAQMVMDQPTDEDMSAFAPARFR